MWSQGFYALNMILIASAFLHEFTVENLIGGSFIRFSVLVTREGIFTTWYVFLMLAV